MQRCVIINSSINLDFERIRCFILFVGKVGRKRPLITMNPSNLKESDVVKALPNFLNTFGTKYTNCCSCGEDYDDGLAASVSNSTEESLMSRKVLKEVCIKSIVPESRLLAETKLDDDSSYPFCSECTAGTVSKLTALFRQLQAVQEEFNELRCQVVSAIIRCYVSVHFNEDDDHHEESTRTHGIGETVFNRKIYI
jgi:hypothetical protein